MKTPKKFNTRLRYLMGDMMAISLVARLRENGYPTTEATVSRWLSGDRVPRAEAIPYIARALDCTPNDLLGFKNGSAA